MPVLAGAGGYDTREVIEFARELEQVGADGLLSVTPYYNKPTQEGLYQHYKAIADAPRCRSCSTTCPAAPASTSRSGTVVRLAGIPNIVGVKEASANVVQMCEISPTCPRTSCCSAATIRSPSP